MELLSQKALELPQFRGSRVGDNAEFCLVFSPINPLIALPRARTRRGVLFTCRPDKDIEEMFSVGVNECGDSATLNDIQPTAPQREAGVREIMDWKSKFDLGFEPGSYGLRIVGMDVSYLPQKQGAQVSINNPGCESRLIVLFTVERGDRPPYDKRNKEESCGS